MSPKASHKVRPGLSSAASLMTTLLISFDQEVLNQHLNLVTPEYPFFESPCAAARVIEGAVRSGQSITFPDGDLTIVGSVSSGAEVVAGGSIHGALRGRAVAG